jgi:hypothetical protein
MIKKGSFVEPFFNSESGKRSKIALISHLGMFQRLFEFIRDFCRFSEIFVDFFTS